METGPADDLLPVTMSVLAASALANEIGQRYDLGAVRRCFLLRVAINHFYVVVADRGRFAARVSLGDWRSERHTAFETAFQRHLRDSGVAVATPIATTSNEHFFTLPAVDGSRTVVLYEWAGETELIKCADAGLIREFGGVIARMHEASFDFTRGNASILPAFDGLAARAERIAPFLEDHPADARLVLRLAATLEQGLRTLGADKLVWSAVHGDVHAANALIDDQDRITVLDFDFCGAGPVAYDIASYLWGSEHLGLDPAFNGAFFEGYESVRPLEKAEHEAIPVLVVAKAVWWLALRARLVDRLGATMFTRSGIDRFMARLRRDAREAGLAT